MTSPLSQSGAELLCFDCASGSRLRALIPCSLHRIQSSNPERPSCPLPDTFLYSSTLSGRNIRLLQLHPGRGDSILHFRLVEQPLDQGFAYHALSYAWGSANITRAALCDGKQLHITENLHAALWQLRQDGSRAFMWVDAVCINQSNIQEKTGQVRMMRDIYRQANLVVAWLGVERETDARGFELMRKLYDTIEMPTLENFLLTDFSEPKELGFPDYTAPEWADLCEILFRPYFFRVWIVQEILAGESCIFQCGNIIVERDVVLGVGAILERFSELKACIVAQMTMEGGATQALYHSARDLWIIKSKLGCGEQLNIMQLLWLTGVFKASDDRDKVFALIGLASNLSSAFIDYNMDMNRVLIEVAKTCLCIESSWGAKLLSWVDSTSHSDQLPSWVPDWTKCPRRVALASRFCPITFTPDLTPNWRVSPHNVSEPCSC
jgi:hypothetical protein